MASQKLMKVLSLGMLSLLLSLSLTLSGCSSQLDHSEQEHSITVAMIVKMEKGDYWEIVEKGAEVAAKEFGVNLIFTGPEQETLIAEQIHMVQTAIDDKVDAIVLAASDYMELGRVTDAAGNAGIPVITIDSEVASTKVRSHIGTDNYRAGYKAGMELVEHVGDNSRVAVVSFVEGAYNSGQREEGLFYLIAQYSGIQVVEKRYSYSNLAAAKEATEQILLEYPDIKGIVALNYIATAGVASVINEKGLGGKVKVVGFDASSEIMEMVQEGVVQSTIVQNSFTMGYLAVKYAVDATKGTKLPERYDSGSVIIDAESMLYEENQKLVFPFVN